MDIKTYLEILWRRKWIIAVTVMVTMAVTIVGTMMITPVYEASATIRVSPGSTSIDYGDVLQAERMMNTFPSIIRSDAVLTELKQRLKISQAPKITVEFPAGSELMLIVVEDQDPVLAADAANILADLFLSKTRSAKEGRSFSISFVDPATPAQSPIWPRKTLNLALGIVVGLGGGLGLAFLFENLDTTLRTEKEIEAVAEGEVLACIPTFKGKQQAALLNGNSPQGESFRRLQTNLSVPDQMKALQTLLVASAEPGEGKSTIIANLALALAQAGRKVVVVDGDLRRPTLHKIFDLPNEVGVSNVLNQATTLDSAIQESTISGLYVLTSGPLPHNPTELLGSPNTATLLEALKQHFDLVLFDTPALLPVIDAAIVVPQVDGTLLVVGQAQVKREDLQSACRQLRRCQAELLGVVMNRTGWNKRYSGLYRSQFD
jgi:capsular exopolysaccharide synthesis family protein